MGKLSYRDIPFYLQERSDFRGNSMAAKSYGLPGFLADTDFGQVYCKYAVFSYKTLIALVTNDNTVIIFHDKISCTTSRHQNLCKAYL